MSDFISVNYSSSSEIIAFYYYDALEATPTKNLNNLKNNLTTNKC